MNKTGLQSKVIDFIQRHGLIGPQETVVVGVSGGADSVCLLHILARWQKEPGLKLHAAHLNHQLRGAESEADARYVSDLAHSLGVPITIDRQDVAAHRAARNVSVEEAARELRYGFLAGVAREVGANRIATGHTRDDQVETVLMHILRGTGTSGLCGLAPSSRLAYDQPEVSSGVLRQKDVAIPYPPEIASARSCLAMTKRNDKLGAPRNDRKGQPGRSNLVVIRPLLDITREETASYCREHRLDPRIDSSNLSLSFFRNRLRLQLLPLLRQYNPGVDRALLRLADIAREDSAFLEQQASELWDEVARQENDAIHLDRKRTARLPVALQRQILRAAAGRLAGDTRDIEATHIEAARSLLNKPVGKRLSLPHGLICHGEYDEIVIVKQSQAGMAPTPPFLPPGEFPLEVPGETVLPGWKVTASIVREPPHFSRHCEEPRSIGATKQSQGWGLPRPYSVGTRNDIKGSAGVPNDKEGSPVGAGPVPAQGHEAGTSPATTGAPGATPRDPRGARLENSVGAGRDPDDLGAIAADFDLHKTGRELFVRRRRPGDRFQPLGMTMPKKVQDFMVDARIPRSRRDGIPIVCSPQHIIWIVGWRIDDRVKVTEASRDILRLEFTRSQ